MRQYFRKSNLAHVCHIITVCGSQRVLNFRNALNFFAKLQTASILPKVEAMQQILQEGPLSKLHIKTETEEFEEEGEIIPSLDNGGRIMEATLMDDDEEVDRLLYEGAAGVDGFGYDESLLHVAAWHGCTNVCRLLLNRGIPTTVFNKYKCTPLHFAAHNGHLQICKMLINWGAPTNVVDFYNSTPLHLVAWRGHVDVCNLLLEWHTPINVCDNYNATPLHVAVAGDRYKICAMLLEHGASTKFIDRNQLTPLQLAKLRGNPGIIHLLEQDAGYRFFI